MRKRLTFGILAICLSGLFASVPATADGSDSRALNILVYGASGKVGTHVVEEALSRGHHVTAVSRDPSRITRSDPHLSVVKGNILDPVSLAELVAGQDVVIVSVRGVIGTTGDPEETVARVGVENVVDALRAEGQDAARLIHVGGSGTLEVAPGKLYADTLPKLFLPKNLETEIAGQVLVLGYLRTVSTVDWCYVTPPKNFTNGKRTGLYRIGGNRVLKDRWGRSRVSRADFAIALIDEAESNAHPRQRISIAY